MVKGMPPISRRTLWLVGLVWAAFLLKTVFYASFLPMWEGYDEYSHFDYVAYLANYHAWKKVSGTSRPDLTQKDTETSLID